MTVRARAAAFVVGAALALGAAGCPRPVPPPDLAGQWPAEPGPYREVHATWTRKGDIRRDYQLVAEAHVTMKSPAWRAAWVARRAETGMMSPASRAELLAAQQQAAEDAVEVAIVLTTWDRRENDLDRGARSVWRVVLVDATGREVEPVEIRRDRRPDQVIRTEFPGYGDFSRAYHVKFPADARVFGPGVERVQVRMSSTRGGMELTWTDRDVGERSP